MRPFGSFVHVILTGLMAIILFACGGSGGGSSSGDPANTVVVTLSTPTAPTAASLWVAAQDGQGLWKALPGTLTGSTTIQFKTQVNDPAGRYGIVMVVQDPMGDGTYYYYGMLEHFTLAEVRKLDFSAWRPVTTANVVGFVNGLGPTDGARISAGSFTKNLNPGTTGAVLRAPIGMTDFIAVRLPGMGPADSVVVHRGVPVTATGPADITFNFDSGWSLVPQAATVANAATSETLSLGVEWMMPSTSIKLAGGGASPFPFNAVPENRMLPGEFHGLSAAAYDYVAWTYRNANSYSLSAANTNLLLPGALAPMTLATANAGPYYRPAATWTALPGAMVHDFFWSDLDGSVGDIVEWEIHLSTGWLGSGNTPSFTFPNLNGTEGWKDAWGLPFGRNLYWTVGERQTTYVDPGFYPNGPRSFKAGNTAWESLVYGGVNVTPGAAPLKRNAIPTSVAPRHVSGVFRGGRTAHNRLD